MNFKLIVLLALSIALFGRGTRGAQQLCTGAGSGDEGFCINVHDPEQVDLCPIDDFTIEDDLNHECPNQDGVR
jgi:hypothetical protein